MSLATGINDDDISVVTMLRNGTIGVLWSNQNTERFGFRVHVDGAAAGTWSADEVPASGIRPERRRGHGRRSHERGRRGGRHAVCGRQDQL